MKKSIVDDIPFALLDWNDLSNLTTKLAQQIEKDGRQYDRIIALANGGLTMVRDLADQLQQKNISLLQISSYSGVAEHDPEPVILQPLPMDVQAEKLLIFEDIVDTGSTLEVLDKYLDTLGVRNYQVATLIEKSATSRQAEFVGEHIDRWIIFPYETKETILDLVSKWQDKFDQPQIVEHLRVIGFTVTEIERVLGWTVKS